MPDILRFGVYELDADARELRREGRLVRLPPQACRLLVALVSSAGEVVSREQLQQTLWPNDVHVDFERSLNTAMRKVRVALHEDADRPRYIQTVQGQGYRFIAPVQRLSSRDVRDISAGPANADTFGSNASSAAHAASVATASSTATVPAVPTVRRARGLASLLASGAIAASVSLLAIAVWNAPCDQRLRVDDARDARVAAATTNGRALQAYRLGALIAGERVSEYSRAIEAYEQAVDLDPRFAPAWAALARARASRAMLDGRDAAELRRARIEAQRALSVSANGDLPDAHLALGQVRFALDDDAAGAEIDMRRARALGATAGRDQCWLVWVLHAQGRIATALRVLDEALSREPDNAELHGWRGTMLHAALRYDEELTELRRAIAIDPDSWEATLQLGLAYSRRRQYDLALPTLRRAVALSDRSGLSLLWLGRISADAGDIASAEHALQQLRELSPTRGLAPSLATSIEYHLAARRNESH